jgi:hypothetical protein
MARSDRRDFDHRFEGADVLAGLLDLAGSPYGPEEVLETFRQGRKAGLAPGDVIPTLFPTEPRFGDPALAQRLFQNLLGLWDLAPGNVSLTTPRPPPKPARPVPPDPLGAAAPTQEWVETAWRYLDTAPRARQRLLHSFENRQDALVTCLDERGLSDEGYGVLRHLAFELHAMLELGCGTAPDRVDPAALEKSPGGDGGPAALLAYADEALFEAEQDEEAPVPAAERAVIRELGKKLVAALWALRRT